ncbi:EAL domain-containing protein [Sinorhizobium numidicum]|uniref:EAL domain-containing protein n=1 Tax=Sinorhizobium numidicum TaxID=680248 RepID=A0ABY8CRE6_9HYPH|nr:EAL domain-containing protein [Sinorhizobium numidicum]WEX75233.1 EAL domain-containing protein [Sinorhizobium numidicum]WEX81228.1 EAL domain-containing protein [Sinorhizobium numidicum]
MKLEKLDNAIGGAIRAMQHGRIGFSLQQINAVDDSSKILYSECLGRLVEPDGMVRTSGEFLAIPEESGIAPAFDRYLLGLAFDWLARHPSAVLGCNISAENVADEQACTVLYDLLSSHSAVATRMILEVRENLPRTMLSVAVDLLQSARVLGYRIALDEFGTGYSTADSLMFIPVDIVKIDASFAQHRRGEAAPILCHMVGLASCAASTVVVEGIETYGQLEAAKTAGATHVQGFLLSEPTLPPIYSRASNALARSETP